MKKNNPLTCGILKFLPGLVLCFAAICSNVVISSCNEPTATDSTASTGHGTASKEDLLKIIEGGWVNEDYADALLRMHSPMFAAEAGRPVQEMLFNPSNIKGDTVFNETGRLNYLDGERFDVVFFDEGGNARMKIYQGAGFEASKPVYLDYKIDEVESDTMLCLVNTATNDTSWFRREFHKAPMKAGIAENALEHFVNRALFEGEWKSANGSVVTFSSNGTVTGWEKWTWFSVEIDKYGSEIQPDVMSAYNDKMGATYVYTLDNDRLSIYEYDSNSEDGMWTRGKMVIELTRK